MFRHLFVRGNIISAYLMRPTWRFMSADSPVPVVGCGSNVVDVFFKVKSMPKAGTKGYFANPQRAVEDTVVGGVTLNHLGWAQCLGVPTGLMAFQGPDSHGILIRNAMAHMGVDQRHVKISDSYTTSVSHIFLDSTGERSIVMAPGATTQINADAMRSNYAQAISSARIVTTEISQVPLSGVIALLQQAKDSNVLSMLDVDVPPSIATTEAGLGTIEEVGKALFLANVIKPSLEAAMELLIQFGEPLKGGERLDEVAQRLQETFGCQLAAVTDGGRGCGFATKTCHLAHPVIPIPGVIDATGAGDAFFGGMVAGLYHYGMPTDEKSLRKIAQIASAAGAANCLKLGALPDAQSPAHIARLIPHIKLPAPVISTKESSASTSSSLSAAAQSVQADTSVLTAFNAAFGNQAEVFKKAMDVLHSSHAQGGIVYVTGVGKSGIVGQRLASSLVSVGVRSVFVHAVEWLHGDLGQLTGKDVVLAISNSGTTPEILQVLPHISNRGAKVVGITGNSSSPLNVSSHASIIADIPTDSEPLGCPTRSIVLQEVVFNAILTEFIARNKIKRETFKKNHPGGAIGMQK